MAAKPYVGVDAVFTLTPVGGGSTVTLKNSDWEIHPMNAIAEAPNTTDGMVRAPGLNDWKGKVKGHTDVTTTSTSIEAQVMPGQIWQFKAYRSYGASTYFSGTLIVGEDLNITTGTGSNEDWDFSFAKAYGALTLPNGTTF